MPSPEVPSANHGTPAMPARAYRARERTPRRAPRAVPTSSAAKVWPVTGTGEPGVGAAICAARPVRAAPPRTRVALRTREAGSRSARTSPGRAVVAAAVLIGTPRGEGSWGHRDAIPAARADHRQRSTKAGPRGWWAPDKVGGSHLAGGDAGH